MWVTVVVVVIVVYYRRVMTAPTTMWCSSRLIAIIHSSGLFLPFPCPPAHHLYPQHHLFLCSNIHFLQFNWKFIFIVTTSTLGSIWSLPDHYYCVHNTILCSLPSHVLLAQSVKQSLIYLASILFFNTVCLSVCLHHYKQFHSNQNSTFNQIALFHFIFLFLSAPLTQYLLTQTWFVFWQKPKEM